MNDLHDSIRDALTADAERAPHASTTWAGPMADLDASPNRRPYAWMAVAATVMLVVGGLWVVARRDTGGTGTPADTTLVGGLDFSGTHRAAMEAEFPPDPGAPMLESALTGSKSGAYELETASRQDMVACMKSVGFEFPWPALTRAAIESDVSPIIRSLTPESAARYGYEGPPNVTAPSSTTAEAYRATLSALKQQLFDAAGQECRTRSTADTFTDYSKYEAHRVVMEEQRNQFIDAFNATPQVRALDAAWSSCMRGKGYAVANIAAAYEMAGAASGRGSKDIAIADANCRAATNYEAQYVELYRNAESAFVYEHRAQILELLQLRYGKLRQSEGKPPISTIEPSPTGSASGVVPSTTAPSTTECFSTYTLPAGKTPAEVATLFDTDLATLTETNKDNPAFTTWRVGAVIFIPIVHTCGAIKP
jgi:hypothetical protein